MRSTGSVRRAGREFQRDSGKAVMKNGTEKEKAARKGSHVSSFDRR